MSSAQLSEHLGYITDPVKIGAYRTALRHFVTPETVVLDLGAGTGILGLLAAECGARRVYAVDNGSILSLAEQAARASGHADRIVHLKAMSTDLQLSEPVDLVVCDQVGGFVHDAGILNFYADAVDRLVRPGGVLIPGSFELQLTPMGGDELGGLVTHWSGSAHHGFDMSVFADAAANTEHRVRAAEADRLGDPGTVSAISANHGAPFGGSVELVIDRAGTFCGLLGTFVAHLAPDASLTNLPWGASAFNRWQNLYPVRNATPVEPGDVIAASIDVSPKSGAVAWRGHVRRGESVFGQFRHDTLSGSFRGPGSVIRASDRWVPRPTDRTALARRIVELCDGEREMGDIVVQIRSEYSDAFVSHEAARSFVSWVLGPVVTPT